MPFRLLPKSFIWLSAAILILTLAGCEDLRRLFAGGGYTVKRVSDGDTMTVTDSSGKNITVRFACVDAPEVPHSEAERKSRKLVDKSQFNWGVVAQQRVQNLVKKGGNRVKLTVTDTDQYQRKISEVRLPDGTFIQQVLVAEGLAQVYRPYLKNCPSASIVEAAEANAKKQRKGVWGDKKYVPAWEWRRNNK